MANIAKDIGEIWTRLFDHRPFLSGEINFFLLEFEVRKMMTCHLFNRDDLDVWNHILLFYVTFTCRNRLQFTFRCSAVFGYANAKSRIQMPSNEKENFHGHPASYATGHHYKKKRDNREVDALFQILQNLTEIRYTQIDKVNQGAEAHFKPLGTKINDCVAICNRILDKEDIFKADTSLERNRESRKKEWEIFIEDQLKKCEKVDKTFKEKEDDLQDYYFDLERKLCISPNIPSKS